jgi:hypothetical protein
MYFHDTSVKKKTGQLVFELMEEEYHYVKDVLLTKIPMDACYGLLESPGMYRFILGKTASNV